MLNLICVWSISWSSWMKSLLHRYKSNGQCFYNWMSHLCDVDKWLVIIILYLESIQKFKNITDKGQKKQVCMSTWKKNYALYRPYKLRVIIERDRKRKRAARHGLQMKWHQREREKESTTGNRQLNMAWKQNMAVIWSL